MELSRIAAGTGGFVITGENADDRSGYAVAVVGDVNGDALADLAVGAPYAVVSGAQAAGKAYVVFGKAGTLGVDLSRVASGEGGFVISGQSAGDLAGISLAAAGDVNGDGLADLIVGASESDPPAGGAAGRSYVVFGKADAAPISLAEVAAGSGGFVINGEAASSRSGRSVAGAGDVNGDGLDDLAIGAPLTRPGYYSFTGGAYLVFGKTSGTPVDLSAVAAGSGGFAVDGFSGTDTGSSIAGAGDVNGDGFGDLIIGAPAYEGSAYVVFGKADTDTVTVTALRNGVGGFEIAGTRLYDAAGHSVAGVGDVNGDGLADMAVGARLIARPTAGRIYLVFGKTGTATTRLANIERGVGGFAIDPEPGVSGIGWSVAGTGDLNGDGLADLLLGSPGSSSTAGLVGAGRSYVVLGKTDTDGVSLTDVARGLGGLEIVGDRQYGFSGHSLAGGGDINGDGLDDLLIGAYGNSALAPGQGASYVVFGAAVRGLSVVDRLGGDGDNRIAGTAGADVFVGGAGSDSLRGNGGVDVLYGGSGDDDILLNASNIAALEAGASAGRLARVDGGSGMDTLRLTGAGVVLDLGKVARQGAGIPASVSRIESIERIELTGSGDNTLSLSVADVHGLARANLINSTTQALLGWANGSYAFPAAVRRHQLIVNGDAGDVFYSRLADWRFVGTAFERGVGYRVYNSRTGRAQLLVNSSVRSGNGVPVITR